MRIPIRIDIVTDFNKETHKEETQLVELDGTLVKVMLRDFFNSMEYSERQAWLAEKERTGLVTFL